MTLLPSARSLRVARLTAEHSRDICTWGYPAPYDCYDMTDVDPDGLLLPDAGVYALLADERLIGFRSFGADGLPGWGYDGSALDTGGGLRPELVGQGLGRTPSLPWLGDHPFRVTVASFTARRAPWSRWGSAGWVPRPARSQLRGAGPARG